jgi:hypothetical protein
MGVMPPGLTPPGLGLGRPYRYPGTPPNGTSEIDTLTIGGTPTGGTFTLTYDGQTTAPIAWSATNATLLANINTALRALGNVGSTNITATANSLTAGIGTITLTFSGGLADRVVALMTANGTALTGTTPTVAVTQATAGVAALHGAVGALCIDTTNALLYQYTGTVDAPTWTKVGTET